MSKTWNNLTRYPLLSVELKNSLRTQECPEEIFEIFDRVLWCYLFGVPVIKEITLYEAFLLDQYMSGHKVPQGFNQGLIEILSNQIGLSFSPGN